MSNALSPRGLDSITIGTRLYHFSFGSLRHCSKNFDRGRNIATHNASFALGQLRLVLSVVAWHSSQPRPTLGFHDTPGTHPDIVRVSALTTLHRMPKIAYL